jgi:hypothetical protein
MFFAIGDTLILQNSQKTRVRVTPSESRPCEGCFLDEEEGQTFCGHVICRGDTRPDGVSVKFVKIGTGNEEAGK